LVVEIDTERLADLVGVRAVWVSVTSSTTANSTRDGVLGESKSSGSKAQSRWDHGAHGRHCEKILSVEKGGGGMVVK